jgi:hypothetical protein
MYRAAGSLVSFRCWTGFINFNRDMRLHITQLQELLSFRLWKYGSLSLDMPIQPKLLPQFLEWQC